MEEFTCVTYENIPNEGYTTNLERIIALTLSIGCSYILYQIIKNTRCVTPMDYCELQFTILLFLMIIVGFIMNILQGLY